MIVRFVIVFGIITLMFGIVRGESSLATFFDLKNSQSVLEDTVAHLERQNSKLKDEISKIKSSNAYAKKVLRERYNVTEESEKIVFFAD